MADPWNELLEKIRLCRHCEGAIPQPNPVFRLSRQAKILVVGQAPGRKVHETGIPWNDPSGDLLRQWLGLNKTEFYDTSSIAILPAGLCYPGVKNGSDLPPRPECAPLWHPPVLSYLKNLQLILLIGSYAQKYYLKNQTRNKLTDTVRAWKDYAPLYVPLVHPSPRNRYWLQKNDWFEKEVIPEVRARVKSILSAT